MERGRGFAVTAYLSIGSALTSRNDVLAMARSSASRPRKRAGTLPYDVRDYGQDVSKGGSVTNAESTHRQLVRPGRQRHVGLLNTAKAAARHARELLCGITSCCEHRDAWSCISVARGSPWRHTPGEPPDRVPL